MRNRIVFLIAAIIMLISALMCGCAAKSETLSTDDGYNEGISDISEAGYRKTVLYFMNDSGYLVPVMKQIPWEEGIGKAALSYLVSTSANVEAAERMGLNTVIPDGTEFALRIGDDGEAVLDLENFTENASELEERAMVAAIVNTLTEFSRIDSVKITVNGKAVSALHYGTSIKNGLSTFALNVEQSEITASTDGAEAMTLYFSNKSGSLNIPVTRYTDKEISFENAMRALIDGPKSSSMLSCFPLGTSLISADITDGVAKVNLSAAFWDTQYTEGLALAAYETMLLTANEIEDVYALDLYVDGEPFELAIETSAPLYANEFR